MTELTLNWISVGGKAHCLYGVNVMLFIEIDVKLAIFRISILVRNAFITRSMLFPVFDDLDLFLTK